MCKVPLQALVGGMIGGDGTNMVQIQTSQSDTHDYMSNDDELLFILERELGLESGAALPLAVLSGMAPSM